MPDLHCAPPLPTTLTHLMDELFIEFTYGPLGSVEDRTAFRLRVQSKGSLLDTDRNTLRLVLHRGYGVQDIREESSRHDLLGALADAYYSWHS